MSYQDLPVNQLPSALLNQDIHILDMRDRQSYELEHLDGAQHASDSTIMKLIRSREKSRPLLVYCYHGISSRDLASFFSNQGFSSVFSLEGGWQAWKNFSETSSLSIPDNLHEWLIKHGFEVSNINSYNKNGLTPLILACLQDNENLVKKILTCKPDINMVNNDGNNALWFCCFNDNIKLIELLLEQGINIDNVNINGATCLIYASSAGKLGIVQCLVETGADLSIQTKDGFNALDSASNFEVLKYLKAQYLNH